MSVLPFPDRRQLRRENIRDDQKRLRVSAIAAQSVYDSCLTIASNLREDGFPDAAAEVDTAVWRLRQAQEALERAAGKVTYDGGDVAS